LVLGGMRSGKSAYAERRAFESGLKVVYVATAQARDAEMQARIECHRARRPRNWGLIEEPVALAAVLRAQATARHCLLVDCMTLWLSNLLELHDPTRFDRERTALLDCLPQLPGAVLLVSNEVGMGIVPMGELSRRFCDEAGRLNQALADRCDRVVLTVAGRPLVVSGGAVPAKDDGR